MCTYNYESGIYNNSIYVYIQVRVQLASITVTNNNKVCIELTHLSSNFTNKIFISNVLQYIIIMIYKLVSKINIKSIRGKFIMK